MGKYKVKLKITGFEMEIEGSREDVPMISGNLARQLGGFLQPASSIVEGEIIEPEAANSQLPLPGVEHVPSKKQRKRRNFTGSKPNDSGDSKAIDWIHDSNKYGIPAQSWTTAQKAMWILYVTNEIGMASEATAGVLTETYNKHFRQFGPIFVNNVARDLGKAKGKKQVGENATQSPSTWFLLDEGTKYVQSLIEQPNQ